VVTFYAAFIISSPTRQMEPVEIFVTRPNRKPANSTGRLTGKIYNI